MLMLTKKKLSGFTLVEIMIAMSILGVLALITYTVAVPNWRARSNYTASVAELNSIANALTLYVSKNNDYPPDVPRGVAPDGLAEMLSTKAWPTPPYPGSVYDYDVRDDPTSAGGRIIQISLRYCAPGDTEACKHHFPKEDFVTDEWDSNSSIYFCIRGNCRAHLDQPANHPGYCINCGNKGRIF